MSRDERTPWLPIGLALAAGLLLWTATALLAGRREPWDWSGYWLVSWPLALLLSGVLGWLFPRRPWRWALALFWSQMLQMMLAGSGLSLWPLGLALLTALALPGMLAAQVAAAVRLRRSAAR